MCIYGSKRDREKLKRENKQKFGGVEKYTTAAAVIQEPLLFESLFIILIIVPGSSSVAMILLSVVMLVVVVLTFVVVSVVITLGVVIIIFRHHTGFFKLFGGGQVPFTDGSKVPVWNSNALPVVSRLFSHSNVSSSWIFTDIHVEHFASSGSDGGGLRKVGFVFVILLFVNTKVFDESGQSVSELDHSRGWHNDDLLWHVVGLSWSSDSKVSTSDVFFEIEKVSSLTSHNSSGFQGSSVGNIIAGFLVGFDGGWSEASVMIDEIRQQVSKFWQNVHCHGDSVFVSTWSDFGDFQESASVVFFDIEVKPFVLDENGF